MGGYTSRDGEIGSLDYKTDLYFDVEKEKIPIVYDDVYNIKFCGMEKLHPFDSCKWGNIVDILITKGFLTKEKLIQPREASMEDLRIVHTQRYLNSLNYSATVAMITEVIPVAIVPNFLVQRKMLSRLRYQVGGTVLAAKMAVERGWAINIGGGFHHCSSDSGGGFCVYADITLAVRLLMQYDDSINSVMIIDLDAHQGNGHERDFCNDENVYILDAYNAFIYPGDHHAKRGISKSIELNMYTEDKVYLKLVAKNIEDALEEFKTDFILYNAGTDILEGDPLGALNISPEGIIERDEIVFEAARKRNIPIAMVTSGGYQRRTAQVIADSIINLNDKGLLQENKSSSSL